MFGPLGEQASIFESYNMTLNLHSYGISPNKFDTDEGLSEFFTPTSISYTPDAGIPFITSMEAKNYPFYGTQFHPEMPESDFNPSVHAVNTQTS